MLLMMMMENAKGQQQKRRGVVLFVSRRFSSQVMRLARVGVNCRCCLSRSLVCIIFLHERGKTPGVLIRDSCVFFGAGVSEKWEPRVNEDDVLLLF
jgi:hypothetical protein